jgi:hypothetical protein
MLLGITVTVVIRRIEIAHAFQGRSRVDIDKTAFQAFNNGKLKECSPKPVIGLSVTDTVLVRTAEVT